MSSYVPVPSPESRGASSDADSSTGSRRSNVSIWRVMAGFLLLIPFLFMLPGPGHFCGDEEYSAGKWVTKRPGLHSNTFHVDVYAASDFDGCVSRIVLLCPRPQLMQ